MDKKENIKELQACIKQMNADFESVDSLAKKITACVEKKRFIPDDVLRQMVECLKSYESHQEICRKRFQTLSEASEIPESLPLFSKVVAEIEQEMQKESLRQIVIDFYRLTTIDEKISGLLEKEKDALDEILRTVSDEETLRKKAYPYIKFSKSIGELASLDAGAILERMTELTSYFSSELLVSGFLQKNIYFSVETIRDEMHFDDSNDLEADVSQKESEEESIALANNVVPEETETSQFRTALEKNNAILPVDFDYGSFEMKESPRETKKFGVKEFKNDLTQFRDVQLVKLEVDIFRLMSSVTVVSKELIGEKVKNIPEDVLDRVFNHLFQHGYLRFYKVGKLGSFYCLSKRGESVFCTKDACKFLGVKMKQGGEEKIEDVPSSAAVRIMLTQMVRYIFRYSATMDSFSSIFLSTNFFVFLTKQAQNGPGNDPNVQLFFGALWENLEECSEFEEIAHTIFKNHTVLKSIVIGGYSRKHASALAKSILDTWPEVFPEQVFLYVLEEGQFYTYKDSMEISDAEIFSVSAENESAEEKIDSSLDVTVSDANSQDEKSEDFSEEIDGANGILPEEKAVELPLEERVEEGARISKNETEIFFDDASSSIESISSRPLQWKAMEQVDMEKLWETAAKLIVSGKTYCATFYLYAYGAVSQEAKKAWKKLAYAVNDPLGFCSYSADKFYDFLDDDSIMGNYLLVATALRTFFYNHVEYDYSVDSFYESVKERFPVKECAALGSLIHTLVEFKSKQCRGIDFYADYRMKDKIHLEQKIASIQREAQQFCERVTGAEREKTPHKRFIKTKELIFSPQKDIVACMKMILEESNVSEIAPLLEEFLKKQFIRDTLSIDKLNIDQKKVSDYINFYWDEAGNLIRLQKKSSDLVGSLRQNLQNLVMSGIIILCDWYNSVELLDQDDNDNGVIAFKKIQKSLLEDIAAAKSFYRSEAFQDQPLDVRAGGIILYDTLSEFEARLDGSYMSESAKDFYVNFLRSDDVLLGKSYFPSSEMWFQQIPQLSIVDRILAHAERPYISFEDRLKEIFDGGDDFGSAEFILSYLGEEKANSWMKKENCNLSDSIAYGRRRLEANKRKFIEDLELMQSYGQIDNATENKKERILQLVTDTYHFCNKTNNFGFFQKVVESFKQQIKEDARIREASLRKEVENYKSELQYQMDEEKLEKLKSVEEMLALQNFTVAEDLLSRIKRDEPESSLKILPKDYLADFIDNYNYYREKVSNLSQPLIKMYKRSAKNKEERAGNQLLERWPRNGTQLNQNELVGLLKLLGFANPKVEKQEKIGKNDQFFVLLEKPADGRKLIYKHPIAEFGSNALTERFRIVFFFGNTDAQRLLAMMKELGNAQNTIIILDCALAQEERRTLARKVKEESFGKVFGVIDRVMFTYLVDHYNEEYINQMLMSLMMPFTYEQPYISDSSKVMPPEIFMGRNEELREIISSDGVNIVYGGRQLGKSALLKMAQKSVDRNENGDRAVFVDIKGLNKKEAARKICHELYDAGIIQEDIDVEDWAVLARIMKQRLQQDVDRIPYFLLLLDEADAFIESCKPDYAPFDALKDIQNMGSGRFKFVVAGLRDIVRFNRDVALGNNSVIPHLKSMTVMPFKYSEAKELLETPLYYLGLRFPKEKESLMSLIFATANYFPGLIQLYCEKLIEAMKKGDYAGYNEINTPPYEVQESHIKKVLAEKEFLKQIQEKFEITLRLGGDNYYDIIALLIAQLYHEKKESDGFTVKDVWEEGDSFSIRKISDLPLEKLEAFMEELCELNILRKNSQERYLFNRYNFFQMMGDQQEVEDKLMEYMEE